MAFRFYQTKNLRFVWTDDENYKICFERPQVQAFDDYQPISGETRILYYYYDFSIFEKDCMTDKWKYFSGVRTHDFPAVRSLKRDIKELITDTNFKTTAQRFRHENKKDFTYTKFVSFSPFCEPDDFYDIRRFYDTACKSEWYDMYLGARHHALLIRNLSADDLWSLYDCAEAFIKYTIEAYNEAIREENA